MLDELQNGRVIVIGMVNDPLLRVRRHDDQRDSGPVTKEVDILDGAGVEVAATFIRGDHDRGIAPVLRRLNFGDEV